MPFAVEPAAALTTAERDFLATLEPGGEDAPDLFSVELADAPAWDAPRDLPAKGPALVEGIGGAVRLAKSDFTALVEPACRRARLHRTTQESTPLLITLKVALAARLPLEEGVALHAAAVARGGDALVFFGPSGAGKSTIAGLSPFAPLSDEMVALRSKDGVPLVSATGFWGSLDRADAPRGAFRVRALLALAKGERRVERLEPRDAFRALLGAALVPPSTALWPPALALLSRLVRAVPVGRLTWSPDAPPWDALEAAWDGRVGD